MDFEFPNIFQIRLLSFHKHQTTKKMSDNSTLAIGIGAGVGGFAGVSILLIIIIIAIVLYRRKRRHQRRGYIEQEGDYSHYYAASGETLPGHLH